MLVRIGKFMAPYCKPASGSPASYLAGVVPSAILQLDATVAASYNGTAQTWDNLIPSPADGSTRGTYDFYRGTSGSASTDDATFNGSAGSAAAYWSVDGGDYFDGISSDTSSYLRNMHRTDASRPTTIGILFRAAGTIAQATLLSTVNTSANHGLQIQIASASGGLRLGHFNGSGSANQHNFTATGKISANTDYLLMISFNSGSPGSEKYWLNSATGTNWSVSYAPSSSSTATAVVPCIAAVAGGHSAALTNGARIYGFFVLNEIINNTKAASIISYYETLHSRDYTP